MQVLRRSLSLWHIPIQSFRNARMEATAVKPAFISRLLFTKTYSTTNSPKIAGNELAKNEKQSVAVDVTEENLPNLMEFFDEPKNWGQDKVKSGRSWNKDELRIKSNSDLHKLWYVLLKERNMLYTMEYAAKKENELMPSPERRDKVEESMENLEEVIKERNRAYHLLETGETGERKVKIVKDGLGLLRRYAEIEHVIPIWMNTSFRKKYYFNGRGKDVDVFLKLLKEKHWNKKQSHLRGLRKHVTGLLKRFPDLEDEVLLEKFPDMDEKTLQRIRHALS